MTSRKRNKREAKPKFSVGDTVQENKHNILINTPGAKLAKSKFGGLRVGEVKNVVTKTNKGGSKCFYYDVLWTNMQSTQIVAQMRLIPVNGACQ
jgi:hypothetical protein